jgi:HD-like signal output (HDOD) protein
MMLDVHPDPRMTTLETSAAAWSAEADLDGAIVDLVERNAVRVAPFPAVASRIERLVAGGDWEVAELERLVLSDPALAGAVLREANAGRRRGRGVSSVEEAGRRLGPHGMARVALVEIHAAARERPGPLAALRRRAWRDAVSCALLCRELARARGVSPAEAQTAGLVHDVGRLLAIALLERIAQGARADRSMPARWWEAVVERYHVRLGLALADRWHLPRALRDAISMHHAARPDREGASEMVTAVSACDAVVRVLADDGRVTDEDATSIRALTQDDADALARTVDRLPRILGGLERDPLSPPAAARPSATRERSPGVLVRIADCIYDGVGFAAHQLIVRGDVPLPEELLLEVEGVRDPSLRFHARVLLCWPEDGRFGAVLMPFALSGPALLHWQGLVAYGGAS